MKITVLPLIEKESYTVNYTTTNGVVVSIIKIWPMGLESLSIIQDSMDNINPLILKEMDFAEKDFEYSLIDDKTFKVSFFYNDIKKEYILPRHTDSTNKPAALEELKSIYFDPKTIVNANIAFEQASTNTL